MSKNIKLTFFGTSDSIPSAERNHTSVLLSYKNENILIDCGEGTQRQFRKAKLNPCKITRIFITHTHGDHVLGLPGILQTLSLSGYNKTLLIYGPRGFKRFFDNLLRTFNFQLNYKIKVEEVDGKFIEEKDFYAESKKMTHGINCNAYSFVRKGERRIDKEALSKMKIPEGEHLQKLKEGKSITHNKKRYSPKDLTFKEEDKKVTLVYDTSFNKNAVSLAKNSDLLVCEATFSNELESEAKEKMHLTAKQAGEIAKKSKSKKLALTHISQRYEKDKHRILSEAKEVFDNSILVKDLDVLSV